MLEIVGWQDLKDLFRKAGNVQRANIMQSRDGRSKGHGIVLYATVADAQKAILEFDGYEWHSRKLEVREDRIANDYPPPPPRTECVNNIDQTESENDKITSTNGLSVSVNSNDINGTSSSTQSTTSPVDYSSITKITKNEILNMNGTNINGITNGTTCSEEYTANNSSPGIINSSILQRQLFVGNLPFRVRWQDLKDLFRKAGTVIRADVALGYDNRSKGHGTVLFTTLEEAKNAIAMFNQKPWQGRILEVREDRGFVDPNVQNNVNGLEGLIYGAPQQNYAGKLLFVGNLPFNCQWQDLKDLFRNAGNIIRADVSTNYDGRSRGFGTVLFATPEDARNAVGMYNGYEFQGRILRVHFDKFSFPPFPPHHHHNPPPHPHLTVHPHHRPPPPPLIHHHNFHLGHPPIPHPHFIPPTHMGPFSPPLTTPSLTSPTPFPTSYNPLAHLNNLPNPNTNATSSFQPIPLVSSVGSVHGVGANSLQNFNQSSQNISQDQPIVTPTTQFSGFGPIGKTHQSPQISSALSNFSALGAFPAPSSNTTNGIANNNGINGTADVNNNNYGSTTTAASNGLGVVHPSSSSSNVVKETDNGSKNGIIGSSSTTTEVTSNSVNTDNNSPNSVTTSMIVPSQGLWEKSTSAMLSTTTVSNGSNGNVNSGNIMSIGMTSSLTGMTGLDSPVSQMVIPTQSVFVRNMKPVSETPSANYSLLYKLEDSLSHKNIIFIGDVHGMINELSELINKIGYDPLKDHLIFVGDLVAKGPESIQVLKLIHSLGASCVRGNHDDKVLRWKSLLDSLDAQGIGLDEYIRQNNMPKDMSVKSEHRLIAEQLDSELYEYFLCCPIILNIPEHDLYVVHAGLLPDTPLLEQNPFDLMNMNKKEGHAWTKYWNAAQEKSLSPKTVIYGHDASRGLKIKPYSFGLDSRCVYGGELSALKWNEREIISVKCKQYAD
ncbi:5827_t:CDS:10 [Funneliformis mosseae]|uniref:5827_t:CDS:1 n=1 Tax=Funneliformis mosseae TaxID=27381 RepID=A0A9N8ZDN0_FUNMO|nr:5827_t:CDS:10 [Funneliformis mosseae]